MKVILYQYSELIRRKDKSIGEACEYCAITWFFVLQISKPMVGVSPGLHFRWFTALI